MFSAAVIGNVMASKRGALAFLAGLLAVPIIFQKMQAVLEPYVARVALFQVHKSPRSIGAVSFLDSGEDQRSLTDFNAKHILVNVWATWCPSCKKEMAALERLQAKLGPDFEPEIIALSVDAISFEQLRAFYSAIGVNGLALNKGNESDVMSALGIGGIPTTLLIDHKGMEIARLVGPTIWDAPEISKQLTELITPNPISSNAI